MAPALPGSASVAYAGRALADVLCLQAERVVGNDNTVRYRGMTLQIPESPLLPESPLRRHFVKVTVRVHDYPDGRLALFHGPRRISPAMTGTAAWRRSTPTSAPPKPARRRAPWICGQRCRVAHNPTGPTAAADI